MTTAINDERRWRTNNTVGIGYLTPGVDYRGVEVAVVLLKVSRRGRRIVKDNPHHGGPANLLLLPGQRREFGSFALTWSAPRGPEVNDNELASMITYIEALSPQRGARDRWSHATDEWTWQFIGVLRWLARRKEE